MKAKLLKSPKKPKKLNPDEKRRNKLKKTQESEIRNVFKHLGFDRLPNIDGKEIIYSGRTSEMDDIFICENIILVTEYTIAETPGSHIKNKILFYNKILENTRSFIEFLNSEKKTESFNKYYIDNIKDKYSLNQLRLKILYVSRYDVNEEHKDQCPEVIYFDYHLVQYFKSLTKSIKKSGKFEFIDFLGLSYNDFGENILKSDSLQSNKYLGHIIPEEKSSFKEGYKIVSFYIDADSLIRRSFVLRQEGWRKKENIGYYQRMLEPSKISGMRRYLSEKGRVFINNIIATISESKIKLYDNNGNELKMNPHGNFVDYSTTKVTPTSIEINDEVNIIGLIDGQHRTYSYHEGDDIYETKIQSLRKIQNLLVTGIIFPNDEKPEARLKFEANLFLEINSNQTNIRSQLKQEIELLTSPFSSVAIGKRILLGLNENGPLEGLIEQYSYEKGKLKTASIVSFGLKPLIKLDEKSPDSLFAIWNNNEKTKLKIKNSEEYDLLSEYIKFCVTNIREIFISLKAKTSKDQWHLYSKNTPDGILNVTFFNGILNTLRILVKHNMINDHKFYSSKLSNVDQFPFRKYKSSQYQVMGKDIFDKYFYP